METQAKKCLEALKQAINRSDKSRKIILHGLREGDQRHGRRGHDQGPAVNPCASSGDTTCQSLDPTNAEILSITIQGSGPITFAVQSRLPGLMLETILDKEHNAHIG
jgi:hypothetical protein